MGVKPGGHHTLRHRGRRLWGQLVTGHPSPDLTFTWRDAASTILTVYKSQVRVGQSSVPRSCQKWCSCSLRHRLLHLCFLLLPIQGIESPQKLNNSFNISVARAQNSYHHKHCYRVNDILLSLRSSNIYVEHLLGQYNKTWHEKTKTSVLRTH